MINWWRLRVKIDMLQSDFRTQRKYNACIQKWVANPANGNEINEIIYSGNRLYNHIQMRWDEMRWSDMEQSETRNAFDHLIRTLIKIRKYIAVCPWTCSCCNRSNFCCCLIFVAPLKHAKRQKQRHENVSQSPNWRLSYIFLSVTHLQASQLWRAVTLNPQILFLPSGKLLIISFYRFLAKCFACMCARVRARAFSSTWVCVAK